MKKGFLYLIPVPLAPEGLRQTATIAQPHIAHIRYFIVENTRSARRFLRAVDKEFPIDECVFEEMDKHAGYSFKESFLKHIEEGYDIGVLSEAGCPAVADPGHQVVALAHQRGITIKPLPGPNSMIMALMASGFPGQNFSFHGYLPLDVQQRRTLLLKMEREAQQGYTHIFMDTPFRNAKLFEDMLGWLRPETEMCIASNITGSNEQIHTRAIKDWKKVKPDLKKSPAVFVIGSTKG
ncbi:MAG: SAM-dependent methyltransferase [Chitinophagales bacterium]|nr:SAM-dependent methyltransferase [Chitinophagales bacterium]